MSGWQEYADSYIEANAQAYDAILPGFGFGDVLRDLWTDLVRPTFITHALCDCDRTAEHHRWNCFGTPIWAQTIRDLDTNPWTVMKPQWGSWQQACGRGPCCLGEGHDDRCRM